mmetsp:Transcript_23304/g.38850  ORF Transcript_23304/g.38850 Transcript_23304/m.38850 type:complete len:309 (+) Transcript_23304:54-980(+)
MSAPVKKKNRMFAYFEEKGFSVDDIPKAIIFHEILGISVLILTWSACYRFPPSQNRFLKEPINRMLSVVPNQLKSPVQANAFLSSKVGTSYIESSCFRKLIRPVTFPLKLYLTFKMIQLLPGNRERLSNNAAARAAAGGNVDSSTSGNARSESMINKNIHQSCGRRDAHEYDSNIRYDTTMAASFLNLPQTLSTLMNRAVTSYIRVPTTMPKAVSINDAVSFVDCLDIDAAYKAFDSECAGARLSGSLKLQNREEKENGCNRLRLPVVNIGDTDIAMTRRRTIHTRNSENEMQHYHVLHSLSSTGSIL